jgi:prephenate dehydrogenase
LTATTVGVFGVGAIGGSIALRARSNGARVIGSDAEPAALEQALQVGAIDAAVSERQLSAGCDVLVIAAHLEPTLREIERLAAEDSPRPVLIIDVASVKVPVVRAARGLRNFVPTHPLAGTERHGVAAARADLFLERRWAYVPAVDDELNSRAQTFIASMGARPLATSAEEHDRAVALTSHLPQIVAACYAKMLRANDGNLESFYGPVARELVRISGMGFALWREVLQANAGNIEPKLRELANELRPAADALARDIDALAPLFAEKGTES